MNGNDYEDIAFEATPPYSNIPGQKKRNANSLTSHMISVASGVGPTVPSLQIDHLPPDEYTIQFGILMPTDPGGGVILPVAAQAIINWKVNGQQLQRRISVTEGASISGNAEAVHVFLEDVTSVFAPGLSPGLRYEVSATICRGTRPTLEQPAILSVAPGVTINGPGSVLVDMPLDAGIISYKLQAVLLGADVNLLALKATTEHPISDGATSYPLIDTGWIPVSPGTRQLFVEYSGATGVRFYVFWGVEG